IYSLLVFAGLLKPEVLVSPFENNPHVRIATDYQFEEPRTAVDPTQALWDPGFSVTLEGPGFGHASYAHLQPSKHRKGRWSDTFVSTEMVLGTRAPQVAATSKNADGSVTPRLANPASNTLRFTGGGGWWSGQMAFNDHHVDRFDNALANGHAFK